MIHRVLAGLAVVLFVSAPVLAEGRATIRPGVVVRAAEGKLTLTDKDGTNERSHDVAKDARITCDGKTCKLEDLKKGFIMKFTLDKVDNKDMVTRIEAMKPG